MGLRVAIIVNDADPLSVNIFSLFDINVGHFQKIIDPAILILENTEHLIKMYRFCLFLLPVVAPFTLCYMVFHNYV